MGLLDPIANLLSDKVSLPNLPKLDLGQEQGKAISSNAANLNAAGTLAGQAATFDTKNIQSQLSSIIPNISAMNDQVSKNLQAELAGQISPDVAQQIYRQSAGSALAGGYAGSGRAGNVTARDLGLTSLGLQTQGLSSLEGWLNNVRSTQVGNPMSVTSMFVSPTQQAQFDNEQNLQQFQHDYTANQLKASQGFGTALAGAVGTLGGIASGAGSAYLGGYLGQLGKNAANAPSKPTASSATTPSFSGGSTSYFDDSNYVGAWGSDASGAVDYTAPSFGTEDLYAGLA
jgi:hypothetical protein